LALIRATTSDNFGSVSRLSSLNLGSLDHLPWVFSDRLVIYFSTDRSGNLDVWSATRAFRAQAFGPPAPVSELNSSAADSWATFMQNQLMAIIATLRPGGGGGFDLFQAVRAGRDDGQELFFVSKHNVGAAELWRSLIDCR
jgi:hypothetical protein